MSLGPTQPVTLARTQGQGDEKRGGGGGQWSAPSSPPSLTAQRVAAGVAEDAAAGEAEWGAPASPSSPAARRQTSSASRRDPRRAELFRRLDAASFAYRRLVPPETEIQPPPPPPPSTETDDPDQPIWPPPTAAGRWYRELRTKSMVSNPANPLLNPNENSLSSPPSKKSRKMLPDKGGDQSDDNEQSSESASYQIVLFDDQGENHFSPVPSKQPKGGINIGAYTVQCRKCLKWRLIPTKEKYEQIREKITTKPFSCEQATEWKPGVTCDDPTDASQDDGRIWAIDKPSILQAPTGWERLIKIRSEGCTKFADVYYKSPCGLTLRSTRDVEKYLSQNQQYAAAAGLELSQFSFKAPKPLQQDYVKKRPPQLKFFPCPGRLQLMRILRTICWSRPTKTHNPASDMQQDQLLDDAQNCKLEMVLPCDMTPCSSPGYCAHVVLLFYVTCYT